MAVASATRPVRHDRTIVLAATVSLTVIAWSWLALAPGGSSFAAAFAMWMIMVVAMMLPPILPWILLFAATERRSSGDRPFGRTGLFVGGYLIAWTTFCAAAASSQLLLHAWVPRQFVDGRLELRAGGALLIVAGLFQLSDLKAACLAHCRNPLGFFLARWSDGPTGALRMGATHGLYCLGCCWALMALSFALGVMNLLWMACLTVMLCIETLAPRGAHLGRVFGLGLLAWGGGMVGEWIWNG